MSAPDASDSLFECISGSKTAESGRDDGAAPTQPVPRARQDADAPETRSESAPPARRHDRSAARHDSRPRAIGYCRVSTDGQATEGVSLDAQRARIASWADANGYRLADVLTDAGLSGKRADNRPGLQAALADVCRAGGALVVYSLSRLARSTRDAIAIAERLDKAGADLVSLTEKIDTTTAAGKMVFRLLAVLNEFERDLASERTRAALAHKRTRNERTGGVPFGWRLVNPAARKKDALMVEAPDEQAVLARIREWHAAGDTLRDIAAKLTAEGVPTKQGHAIWTHQAVGKIVTRSETAATT